jgi:2-polyprenyl-6-methoxyphenol hydroxylase-like FAD-dependent oxidoreductase
MGMHFGVLAVRAAMSVLKPHLESLGLVFGAPGSQFPQSRSSNFAALESRGVSYLHDDGYEISALVGDAGYCPSPASGQGTSLALVGAEVLASELAAAGGDHARAFVAYEARMRPFVARNQALGRDVAQEQVQSGRAQIWARQIAVYDAGTFRWSTVQPYGGSTYGIGAAGDTLAAPYLY